MNDLKIEDKKLIAHRARNKTFMENTLKSFRDALKLGTSIVEVDIRFSKDGVPFLYHLFVTSDTDRKFIFSERDAEYIKKRKYNKTGQKINSLEEIVKYFIKYRRPYQKLAIDVKDFGYEKHLVEFFIQHDILDKIVIFTWTPQTVFSFWNIFKEKDIKIPIFFTHLRSDALLKWFYHYLFGYHRKSVSSKKVFSKKYRYIFLNHYNYKKPLGELSKGHAHIYFSPKGIPKDLSDILRKSGGGVCVNSRFSDRSLKEFKKQKLKVAIFGGAYGILRIVNMHKFAYIMHNKRVDYIFIDKTKSIFKNMVYTRHIALNAGSRNWFLNVVKMNFVFYITSWKVWNRKSFLNKKEMIEFRNNVHAGDIVLMGQHKYLSGFLIRGIVTHSGIFYKDNEVIHSVVDGVDTITVEDIFDLYDTVIVLRKKGIKKLETDMVLKFLKKSLSTPYDFSFSLNNNKFYCTELVYKSYLYAKINQKEVLKNDDVVKVIEAWHFLKTNYDIVFLSKSLVKDNLGIHLNSKMYKNKYIRKYLEK